MFTSLSLCSPPPRLFCLLLRYLLSVLLQNKDASRQFSLKESKEMPEAQRQNDRKRGNVWYLKFILSYAFVLNLNRRTFQSLPCVVLLLMDVMVAWMILFL